MTIADMLDVLAILTASSLNAVNHGFHTDAARLANADRLAKAVTLDMLDFWQPTEEYFNRVSKAAMAEAILEAGVEGAASYAAGLTKLTKGGAVAVTVKLLTDTAWLPLPLRPKADPVLTVVAAEAEDDRQEEDGRQDLPELETLTAA